MNTSNNTLKIKFWEFLSKEIGTQITAYHFTPQNMYDRAHC